VILGALVLLAVHAARKLTGGAPRLLPFLGRR
jgi:hypothetical protein